MRASLRADALQADAAAQHGLPHLVCRHNSAQQSAMLNIARRCCLLMTALLPARCFTAPARRLFSRCRHIDDVMILSRIIEYAHVAGAARQAIAGVIATLRVCHYAAAIFATPPRCRHYATIAFTYSLPLRRMLPLRAAAAMP